MTLIDYQKGWDNFNKDLYLAYLEAKIYKMETDLLIYNN